jgi:hypothetical protein
MLPPTLHKGWQMNAGRTVFAQVTHEASHSVFQAAVAKYNGDRRVRRFTCWNQWLVMAFAQLTYRESLRDIEVCLRAMQPRLYHMGIRARISRNTLAVANEKRDWRIYAEFALSLIHEARTLYAGDAFDLDLEETVYALDSSTIDLCLALFPWARFQEQKGAIKLHTLLDLRGNIPAFVHITDGKVGDVKILDMIEPEPGSIYVLDRGYIDYERLHRLTTRRATFVTRAKKNMACRRRYSRKVDRTTGLAYDQTIMLTDADSAKAYPAPLRRVRYSDPETKKKLTFLTNNFELPALTIALLYKARWRIELFFKWIKQHLRIKAFYGRSANAVKTQIWIAIGVYVLVAIVRKRLGIKRDLYTLLQILSVTCFEKMPLGEALSAGAYTPTNANTPNQLSLFNL